jgi:hypothetical protein
MNCDRCNDDTPATRHLEWRQSGDAEHWANRPTDRCDKCADDLRDWARIYGGASIVIDRPLGPPPER